MNEEILNLTQPTGMRGADPPFSTLSVGGESRQFFTSTVVDLGAYSRKYGKRELPY